MSEPKEITEVINAIERANKSPRDLARQAVAQWRSDAQREQLPVTNQHDDKGAPVLRADDVLRHDDHDKRLGRK